MLNRTHTAIGLAVGLYFLPYVVNKLLFIPVVVLASILPDIDSGFSVLGRKPFFRPFQAMTSHRGIFHTYTLCIIFTILLALFYPILALPFFLGYSFHLFADTFTIQGIKPFWPFKVVSKGIIASGGKIDKSIFWLFVGVDVVLCIVTIMNAF